MNNIPEAVLGEVLGFCECKQIRKLERVNKSFRNVSSDRVFWCQLGENRITRAKEAINDGSMTLAVHFTRCRTLKALDEILDAFQRVRARPCEDIKSYVKSYVAYSCQRADVLVTEYYRFKKFVRDNIKPAARRTEA